ncbi:beta-ketoacyl-ACP synthase III [Parablautia intestinalis]|uniref:beta-ketoacyl-ACP synthase III n=1 Tax=Parablautia intestinalis TaxID=2320100 RepID=UPI00259C8E56|nr:beta-ketoacyl-ACP synthase III [Parablautia intestinalis]
MPAKIIGTGSALPGLVVTNKELEQIMDTTDEWISSRTGIRKRHIAVEETTTSMAIKASETAVKKAGIRPEEIDLIIVGTVSGDKYFPSTACQIQEALSAQNAVAFDVNAACAGFLFGMTIADAYFQAGRADTALIVGAETLSKMVDWKDRSTCVLFGDGAGAAVVRKEDSGILHIVQGADGARGSALSCDSRPVNSPFARKPFTKEFFAADSLSEGSCADKPSRKDFYADPLPAPDYLKMDGQEVFRFAVRTVPKAVQQVLAEAGILPDEVKYFFLHQANIRIIEAVAKKLAQPMEKFPTNLQRCGNISAASVPILLDHVNREGKLQKGDKIVLAGFGAGLTWGAAVLTW